MCHACKKIGHFAKFCGNKISSVDDSDDYFIGTVLSPESAGWKTKVMIAQTEIYLRWIQVLMRHVLQRLCITEAVYYRGCVLPRLCITEAVYYRSCVLPRLCITEAVYYRGCVYLTKSQANINEAKDCMHATLKSYRFVVCLQVK